MVWLLVIGTKTMSAYHARPAGPGQPRAGQGQPDPGELTSSDRCTSSTRPGPSSPAPSPISPPPCSPPSPSCPCSAGRSVGPGPQHGGRHGVGGGVDVPVPGARRAQPAPRRRARAGGLAPAALGHLASARRTSWPASTPARPRRWWPPGLQVQRVRVPARRRPTAADQGGRRVGGRGHRSSRGPRPTWCWPRTTPRCGPGRGPSSRSGWPRTSDGSVQLGDLRPSGDVPLTDGAVPVTGDFERNWGWLNPTLDLRNLGWTPQFDVTAPLAAAMWTELTGQPVDGVISLDVAGLRQLLEATGPVQAGRDDGHRRQRRAVPPPRPVRRTDRHPPPATRPPGRAWAP